MKKTLLFIALLFPVLGFAQSINDYKYIIVPEKFVWLKEENQYNMNAITKMMFEKYGWRVFYQSEKLPDELALDKCKALYANVLDGSALLHTSITIVLKDCKGRRVFVSQEGKSKEKKKFLTGDVLRHLCIQS